MNKTLTLHLIKLNCFVTEEDDDDEVYLKINGKKIWPLKEHYISMKPGLIELNVEVANVEQSKMVNVELWDYDALSANDLMGTFRLIIDKPGGPYNTDLTINKGKGDRARYNLEWKLL
jgi:hypothetical protein